MNYAPNWMIEPTNETANLTPANQNHNVGPFQRLRTAQEGTRNSVLNECAFRLSRAENALGEPLANQWNELKDAAIACGLSPEEISRTITSAIAGAARASSDGSSRDQSHIQPLITASPYTPIDPATLPKRDFIFGNCYIRKYVSATVAPGGVGKSALTLLEAVLMASGRDSVGMPIGKTTKVWVFNLEDPLEELQRRVEGIRLKYGIQPEDIVGNLFLDSGRDQELVIAKQSKAGTTIVPGVETNLVTQLQDNEIDVIIIDPFISCHLVSENDNGAIDAVVKAWGRIADKAKVSVQLVHHTRKEMEGVKVSIDSVRGGKAFGDAIRNTRLLEQMSEATAASYGILNPQNHFGVFAGKESMTAQSTNTEWYEMVSVELGNGDSVGVPVHRQHERAKLEPTPQQMERILTAIGAGSFRKDVQAREWAGKAIAEALELDYGPDSKQSQRSRSQRQNRRQIIELLERLIADETLQIEANQVNGKATDFISVRNQNTDRTETDCSSENTASETQLG